MKLPVAIDGFIIIKRLSTVVNALATNGGFVFVIKGVTEKGLIDFTVVGVCKRRIVSFSVLRRIKATAADIADIVDFEQAHKTIDLRWLESES